MSAKRNKFEDARRQSGEETHFGFETVDAARKPTLVRQVFESVADRYDLMNDLMSGGIHRLWKNTFVDQLAPRPEWRYLDVGGGTGDIAFRIIDRLGGARFAGHVTVCDINKEMLRVGRDRAIDRGLLRGLSWLQADAEALPLDDESVDAYTIAFCIRNVTHVDRALAEAYRVLKPGGRFLCLEFSQVELPILERAYDLYSFNMLPALGRLVAGDSRSYRYLAESIRKFPGQEEFAMMIEDAGFDAVGYRNLTGGIAAIHWGRRP